MKLSELQRAEIIEQKRLLRQKYREAIQAKGNAVVDVSQLIEFLRKVLPKGAIIGAFRPMSDEASLQELYQDKSYQWAFPRIDGDSLVFCLPHDENSFRTNQFGIEEPRAEASQELPLAQVEALLIPAVAFDRKCRRLGRGKGYYDRILENFNGLKVGVASTLQIAEADLPTEPHDVAMDLVVTDHFILRRFDS